MYSNETRIYFAILTAVVVLAVVMTFFIITIIRYQKSKVAFHRKKIKSDIILLEKERARIASDLHDDLGASLSAIKLHLQCLEPVTGKASLSIEKLEYIIDEAMQKVRLTSYNMMPQLLHRKGLEEALKELVSMVTYNGTLKINFKYYLNSINKEMEIHVYRIIQEIINNITRHAKASVVNFTLNKVENIIQLHIQDNGIGFDKSMILKKVNGLGIQNIMSRVDVLNARIYLTTENGKGVDYLIEIPDAL